jgi:hypothetical protein
MSFEMIFVFEPWLRVKLDPENKLYKTWNTCASMATERASFSHLVLDNMVYVFGGISGKVNEKSKSHFPVISNPNIEKYDPK